MHVTFSRDKERHWPLSIVYRLMKLPAKVVPGMTLLRVLTEVDWIVGRLVHEQSCKSFPFDQHPMRLAGLEFALRRIDAGTTVLDLGCSTGDMTYLIAQNAKEVVGVEHNPVKLAAAKDRFVLPNLSFLNDDAVRYLERTGKKFDVLVLAHVLEHLDAPGEFLRSFRSYFKRIYIEVPDFDATFSNVYRLRLGSKLLYSDNDHIIEFDREELHRIVEEAGMEVLESEARQGMLRLWCSTGG